MKKEYRLELNPLPHRKVTRGWRWEDYARSREQLTEWIICGSEASTQSEYRGVVVTKQGKKTKKEVITYDDAVKEKQKEKAHVEDEAGN